MKKLLLFLSLSLVACMAHAETFQLFGLTGLTGIEFIKDKPKATAPLDLGYNLIFSLNADNTYFVGGGVSAGLNLNDNDAGEVKGNVIAAAYIGGQVFTGLPAMAIGPMYNFVSGNWGVMYTLHFAPTELFKSIKPASPTYRPPHIE